MKLTNRPSIEPIALSIGLSFGKFLLLLDSRMCPKALPVITPMVEYSTYVNVPRVAEIARKAHAASNRVVSLKVVDAFMKVSLTTRYVNRISSPIDIPPIISVT